MSSLFDEMIQESLEKDQKIADLEAKLAVSENTITNLIEDNRASQEWYKKQLAEKEKENELMAKTLKMTKFIEKEVCQDKISFAVEQLRQVQKYIITDEKDMFGMPYLMKPSYVYDFIDNQIKQLKEMK